MHSSLWILDVWPRNIAKSLRFDRQNRNAIIERLRKELNDNAVLLGEKDSADMNEVTQVVNDQVAAFPEVYIQRLFWDQLMHWSPGISAR